MQEQDTKVRFIELNEKLQEMYEDNSDLFDVAKVIGESLDTYVIITNHKNEIVGNYGPKIPINCLRYSMQTKATLHLFSMDPLNEYVYDEPSVRNYVLPVLVQWFETE